MSTEELKLNIANKLKDYLKDAVVPVMLTNFKVTVIGEAGNPVVLPVNGQNINVLEAFAAACAWWGDMTVYGMRKNVKVIRKLPDDKTEIARLNFNKSDVLSLSGFNLKQNDIVYVYPNKSKGILGTRTGVWVPIISTLFYTAAIIISRI